MRKVLAVMLISGSLAAGAVTAFAANASDRESTDGIRFMAQDVTNVEVSSQPEASTITLPIADNHDRMN